MYTHKYLKYKHKYLQLVKYGGAEVSTTPYPNIRDTFTKFNDDYQKTLMEKVIRTPLNKLGFHEKILAIFLQTKVCFI